MNNFSYTVFGQADFDSRAASGFTGGNFSTDGTMVIGDRGQVEDCEDCDHDLAKPSYLGAMECLNWPHLNHNEAKDLVNRAATSNGASDGWSWSAE